MSSDVIAPSAYQWAFTPAEVTPFHVADVVVTVLQIRRHGFADPALDSKITSSRVNGSMYMPPVPEFSNSAARHSSTSVNACRSSSDQRSTPAPERNAIGSVRIAPNADS